MKPDESLYPHEYVIRFLGRVGRFADAIWDSPIIMTILAGIVTFILFVALISVLYPVPSTEWGTLPADKFGNNPPIEIKASLVFAVIVMMFTAFGYLRCSGGKE